MKTSDALLWSPAGLELGEGPRWVDGRLVLVDILSGTLLEADGPHPGDLRPTNRLEIPLGAVAPVAGQPGRWIAAAGTGVALLDPGGVLTWLGRPVGDGPIPRRMNDGVCDPAGRFWAGCMAWDGHPGAGALYRTGTQGQLEQVLDGLSIPNGPAFSTDGTIMYLADSAQGLVLRFPVDPTSGDLGDPVTFVVTHDGSPDGMTVDVAGNLWVAVWGAGEVRRYSPQGRHDRTVRVPAPQPTAPCLGGPDGTRLYVTTARYGLPPKTYGHSGGIFVAEVDMPGIPAAAYGGVLPDAG
ncbi:SMP-30/gluconolactonase/LRE family protein [Micromonospora coxensis]|uniref:Sugar lactone lactonase YvrE n=1 Tax=Micromonospora coxensis TaxID=356852 RepID=A0A1C5GZ43_9ACTN|nr:SMP-30/gluconolactonase/LRE family protein [Micromonospora coxensis]SCG39072.1 Sugar lactone lactonase YvrE [Micromonospora coxensis]